MLSFFLTFAPGVLACSTLALNALNLFWVPPKTPFFWTFFSLLIGRGRLDMIDHQSFHLPFCRLEPQTELIHDVDG